MADARSFTAIGAQVFDTPLASGFFRRSTNLLSWLSGAANM